MQRRFSLPISIRILSLVVLPLMSALIVGFWILNLTLTDSVKSGARETLADVQQADRKLWAESDQQQRAAVGAIAENPALKAGMMLFREHGRSEEAAATLREQLDEIHSGLTYDLLAVLNAEKVPLAATTRNAKTLGISSLLLGSSPISPRGVFEADGKVYRAITMPVNLGDENLGFLVTGRLFDVRVPYGFSVLLRGNQVVLGPEGSALRNDLAGRLSQCTKISPTGDCELQAGGETWIASRLNLDGFDADYALWILQSVDATLARLTAGVQKAFAAVVAIIVLIAALLAWIASRGVAYPLTQLVKRLRESERTGVLRGDLEVNSTTSEVNELARAFNVAAKALADSQRRLDEAYLQFTQTMAQALDARDHYTAGHSSRVSTYATRIAKALALPSREQSIVEVGATLHDIGKIGVPDCVLQKPDRLTDDEFERIKEHPLMGKRILEGVVNFRDYLTIVELHHENHDGSGYPWGLSGENIPLGARIVHVVDAFDAMTSSRPYRDAMPAEKALAILEAHSGTQFDPAIVQVFLELVRADPALLGPEASSIVNLNQAVGSAATAPLAESTIG